MLQVGQVEFEKQLLTREIYRAMNRFRPLSSKLGAIWHGIGAGTSKVDDIAGSCFTPWSFSLSTPLTGDSWNVVMKVLGGLLGADPDELEDEDCLIGLRWQDTGLKSSGDHVNSTGFVDGGVDLSKDETVLFLVLAFAFLMTCELSSLNMRSTIFL